jgi:hypothetical protein
MSHTPFANANVAGWSSPVARQAHNLKVTGSNPVPATNPTELDITPPLTGGVVVYGKLQQSRYLATTSASPQRDPSGVDRYLLLVSGS